MLAGSQGWYPPNNAVGQKGLNWLGAEGEQHPQAVLEQPLGEWGDGGLCREEEWAGGSPGTQRRKGR